eukprot:GILJ01011346.1.p1 GENE.GILJ01011346.1~~GILJ01011346.1.p1  ORF type:complete len:506 (-),score=53.35 GILJ01011346.1:50-1567(-)
MTEREILFRKHVHTGSLLILALAALGVLLFWLRVVFVPLLFGFFLYYLLVPIVDFLHKRPYVCPNPNHMCGRTYVFSCLRGFALRQRVPQRLRPLTDIFMLLRVPKVLSSLAALFAFVFLMYALGKYVFLSIHDFAENHGTYADSYDRWTEGLSRIIQSWGVDKAQADAWLAEKIEQPLSTILIDASTWAVQLVTDVILTLIITFFLLVGKSTRSEVRVDDVYSAIEVQIKQYIVLKTLICAFVGFLVWLILFILNIDLAIVFGLCSFILNFIPNVGSVIATCLPLPILIFSEASWTVAVLGILLPGLVHMTVGNVIEPKVFSHSSDLHPISVLLSLLLWGAVWGVAGMILAVPLTSSLKIIFERMESPFFGWAAKLLEGRFGYNPLADDEKVPFEPGRQAKRVRNDSLATINDTETETDQHIGSPLHEQASPRVIIDSERPQVSPSAFALDAGLSRSFTPPRLDTRAHSFSGRMKSKAKKPAVELTSSLLTDEEKKKASSDTFQ